MGRGVSSKEWIEGSKNPRPVDGGVKTVENWRFEIPVSLGPV